MDKHTVNSGVSGMWSRAVASYPRPVNPGAAAAFIAAQRTRHAAAAAAAIKSVGRSFI